NPGPGGSGGNNDPSGTGPGSNNPGPGGSGGNNDPSGTDPGSGSLVYNEEGDLISEYDEEGYLVPGGQGSNAGSDPAVAQPFVLPDSDNGTVNQLMAASVALLIGAVAAPPLIWRRFEKGSKNALV
ncbi:MAG: hypothetical protein FWG16_04285, partial [Micrococcales bacterium]|nr:hypothetical protein [Micrococcales bacterium]